MRVKILPTGATEPVKSLWRSVLNITRTAEVVTAAMEATAESTVGPDGLLTIYIGGKTKELIAEYDRPAVTE